MITLRTRLALGLLSLTISAAFAQSPGKPNILVILADDVGYSDTGAFGGEIRTPNIDKLAEGGRKFTSFYNTARCCPSRASLLTGLYPHQAGVGHMLWDTGYPGYDTHLTSHSVTIPEVLHSAGYRNYMVGKWHLSEREPNPADPKGWPLQRGFDKFYGTLYGYGSYFDPAGLCRDNTYITPQNDPAYKPEHYYYTDAISDNAIAYIKDHKAAAPDKPFMMYVAYTAAHWPLHVPEDSLVEYRGKYDAGYDAIRQQRLARLKELGLMDSVTTPGETTGDWNAVTDKAWEAGRMEAFAAIITRMDTGIGRILDHLRATGQLDNTIVMFLQDNGGCDEEFFMDNKKQPDNLHVMAPDELQRRTLLPMQTRDGKVVKAGPGVPTGPAESYNGYGPAWANVSDTPFRKVKKYTFEGGIATPLIIHWPAAIAPAKDNRIATPGHLVDIMPTIVEAAGATYPAEFNGSSIQPLEGKSLLPLLKGQGAGFPEDRPIFWEHEGNRAVRMGRWKIVADENKPWQLYDLQTDRGESTDLADQQPDRLQQMINAWDAYASRAKVEPLGAHRLRSRTPDPEGTSSTVTLSTGDVYPRANAPALSGKGVAITARIARTAADGVIVSQGGSAHGYALYMKDGRAHFTIKRDKDAFDVQTAPIPADASAVITARLDHHGALTLQVQGQPAVTGTAYGPLLLTPNEALTAGFDQDTPVGNYEGMFSFQGDLEKDGVTVEVF